MSDLRLAGLALCALVACGRGASIRDGGGALGSVEPSASIEFRLEGRLLRSITLAALERSAGVETVTNFDPYYRRVKSFRALSLERVLGIGFPEERELARRQFVIRARDGYTVPMAGERLLEGGAYLAVRDVDSPSWDPIGPQRANPGPVYFIWKGATQTDLESHPRPWQLAVIEITRFELAFPHTAPIGEPADSAAMRGFDIFARECVRCHAVNREGGRVGPELNVPQNITEYRPEPQVREYIRNPMSFRYGNMPPHPHLTDANLDELLSYLRAMRTRKHDPDAIPAGRAP